MQGFEIAGPWHLQFAQFVERVARQNNKPHIAFIARDCYTLQKVFNIIQKDNLPSMYLYAPRFVAQVIRLRLDDHKDYIVNVILSYHSKQLGIEDKTYPFDEAMALFDLHQEKLKLLVKEKEIEYQKYLDMNNVTKDTLFVDETACQFNA